MACLVLLSILFLVFYWYNNRLFLFEAKMIWPQKNFNADIFRVGAAKDRASMAVNLIESKKLIGTPITQIPTILGEPNGDYYHQDGNHTYELTEKGNADWILTVVATDDGNVGEIFVRKSCCSISHDILYFVLSAIEKFGRGSRT